MKCLWCQSLIESVFFARRGAKMIPYQACDKDCAHGIDVCAKLDALFFEERSPLLSETVEYTDEENNTIRGDIVEFYKDKIKIKLSDNSEAWVGKDKVRTLELYTEEEEEEIAFV